MSDLPSAQKLALESWAKQASQAGWLQETATTSLNETTTDSAEQLFEPGSRPLVAGLFGGTGVGKSSLLNRLAGETIAKASAERPTSRDITVYSHSLVTMDKLPEDFPLERMQTAHHNNERYRNVLFIDMPDFDSVETANRDLVDLWLPHLDVVLYVVSPDRYRDDQGWQLLIKHVQQHAWLFVMNHWDRGEAAQVEDFRAQLGAAGLHEPLVFCTDCSSLESATHDDFDNLQASLVEASDKATIKALNEHGILARLKALKSLSDPWHEALGTNQLHQDVTQHWFEHWNRVKQELKESLAYRARQVAQQYADNEGSWIARLLGKSQAQPIPVAPLTLIDDFWLERLDNSLADFLNEQALSKQIPLAAMQQAIAEPYSRARRDIAQTINDSLQRAVATPGPPWQRYLYKALGWLSVLLPLTAMGWIGWRIVRAFIEGGSNPAAYLGGSFAINGFLLLALAWLLPTFSQYKVRPSREKAALRGINAGLSDALKASSKAVGNGFDDMRLSASDLRRAYTALWTNLAQSSTANLPAPVRRMLATELAQPLRRSLDVRANTQSSTDAAPLS